MCAKQCHLIPISISLTYNSNTQTCRCYPDDVQGISGSVDVGSVFMTANFTIPTVGTTTTSTAPTTTVPIPSCSTNSGGTTHTVPISAQYSGSGTRKSVRLATGPCCLA